MRMRFLILIGLSFLLSACAQTWEANPPEAASGGMGVMADGTVAQGPGAVASVNDLPTRTPDGIQPPYGAKGSAAAYEFDKGYRVGAGDGMTISRPREKAVLAGMAPAKCTWPVRPRRRARASKAGRSGP
ncbi:MAG: hypothetical protein AB7I72_08070, partial [Parvibaculaceae bacterium]